MVVTAPYHTGYLSPSLLHATLLLALEPIIIYPSSPSVKASLLSAPISCYFSTFFSFLFLAFQSGAGGQQPRFMWQCSTAMAMLVSAQFPHKHPTLCVHGNLSKSEAEAKYESSYVPTLKLFGSFLQNIKNIFIKYCQ